MTFPSSPMSTRVLHSLVHTAGARTVFLLLLVVGSLGHPAVGEAKPKPVRAPTVQPPAQVGRARRCVVPQVDNKRIERAIALLASRPASRAPSKLWALLPARVTAGGKQSISNGAGLTTADDASSLRWLAGDRRGWSVRVAWDLTRLWKPSRQRRPAPLDHALLVDRVVTRIAAAVLTIGVARATAMGLSAGSGACGTEQAKAAAAVLRLRALLAAARSIRNG